MFIFKGKKEYINKLVDQVHKEDLAELEDYDVGLADFHRGYAQGLRHAIELLDKYAVPDYELIDVGSKIQLVRYEEQEPVSELTLEWSDA